MPIIRDLTAIQTLDSRGMPAIHVSLKTEEGYEGKATISLGQETKNAISASIAIDGQKNEVTEIDNALNILNTIIKPRLINNKVTSQQEFDTMLIQLDSSPDKKSIHTKVIIAVSVACAKVMAQNENKQLFEYFQSMLNSSGTTKLPTPSFTVLEGGQNANYIIDMEEFILIPASNKSFPESLKMGINYYHALKDFLLKENLLPVLGEKGGFAPLLSTNEDALSLLKQTADSINIRLGYDLYLGINVAANNFCTDNRYKLKDKSMSMSHEELISLYDLFYKNYHVLYLEDPLASSHIEAWSALYKTLNQNVTIAGNTLTQTNPIKLQAAIQSNTINGIVINPVDIGTISEALAVAIMAQVSGMKIIVSDKTGETTDTFLADFAVAINADYVKFGAPARGERVAKYNRLLEIEKLITDN